MPDNNFDSEERRELMEPGSAVKKVVNQLKWKSPLIMSKINELGTERREMRERLLKNDLPEEAKTKMRLAYRANEWKILDQVTAGITGFNPMAENLWLEVLTAIAPRIDPDKRTQICDNLVKGHEKKSQIPAKITRAIDIIERVDPEVYKRDLADEDERKKIDDPSDPFKGIFY
jgi:hypothetical protein